MKKAIDKFMDKAVEKIKGQLGSGHIVEWSIFHKYNGVYLRGIVISDKTSAVSPCIYMDGYYTEYNEKRNMDSIINEVIQIYEKNRGQDLLADMIQNREQMLDRVLFRLINTKKNERILTEMPHHDLDGLGLSMVFYVLFQIEDENQNATMMISNKVMKMWSISKEELLERARRNTPSKMGYSIRSIQSVLGECLGIMAEEYNMADWGNMPRIFVLTNFRALYGASCLVYDGLLEKVAESLGSGFYILPSSVHEVLLCPSPDKEDAAVLKEIVTEINHTILEEEEVLIDAVYYYDKEAGELSAA